jgi:hypothetical protein
MLGIFGRMIFTLQNLRLDAMVRAGRSVDETNRPFWPPQGAGCVDHFWRY